MMSAKSTRAGVIWATLSGLSNVVIPFGVFVVFARLVSPNQLGIITIAIALLEFLKALTPQGCYEILMQRSTADRLSHAVATSVLLVSGTIAGLLYIVAVELWVLPMHPNIEQSDTLVLLAGKCLLDVVCLQPQAMLSKQLAYRRMASRSVIANVVAGVIGSTIAVLDHPMLGLVAYYLAQSATNLLVTTIGSSSWVAPRFNWIEMLRLVADAGHATGVRFIGSINSYVDQLVLSTLVDAKALGLFGIGRRLELVFVTLQSSIGSILLQPNFSNAAFEYREQHFRRGVAAVSLICGVPAVVLVVTHQTVVPLLFGKQWIDAAPIVAFLGISGYLRALGGVHGALLSVSGHNRDLMFYALASALSGILLAFVFVPFGVLHYAVALAVKNAVFLLPAAWLTRRPVPHAFAIYLREAVLPLSVVAIVAAATYFAAYSSLGDGAFERILTVFVPALLSGFVGLALIAKRI